MENMNTDVRVKRVKGKMSGLPLNMVPLNIGSTVFVSLQQSHQFISRHRFFSSV